MKRFSLYIFLFLLTLALLSRSNELSLESDVAVEDTTEDPQTINNSNDDNDVNPESTDSVEPIAEDISPSSSSSVPAQTTNILLPHIFVLNLDRATDRWQNIQSVMNAADLSIERLPGVDGRQLSPKELKEHSSFLARTFQPRGVVGCYISHRKLWQTVVDRNLDSAILFEDDVQLVPDFKQVLQTRLAQLKEDKITYDIIFLGAIGMVHPQRRDSFFSRLFALYMGGCRKFCKVNDYLYQPTKPAVNKYIIIYIYLNMS